MVDESRYGKKMSGNYGFCPACGAPESAWNEEARGNDGRRGMRADVPGVVVSAMAGEGDQPAVVVIEIAL